jgi:hypothetical protein
MFTYDTSDDLAALTLQYIESTYEILTEPAAMIPTVCMPKALVAAAATAA